ncbi:MAG: hypothetical protein R6U50_18090 [Desulfobacterales bacterium]
MTKRKLLYLLLGLLFILAMALVAYSVSRSYRNDSEANQSRTTPSALAVETAAPTLTHAYSRQ